MIYVNLHLYNSFYEHCLQGLITMFLTISFLWLALIKEVTFYDIIDFCTNLFSMCNCRLLRFSNLGKLCNQKYFEKYIWTTFNVSCIRILILIRVNNRFNTAIFQWQCRINYFKFKYLRTYLLWHLQNKNNGTINRYTMLLKHPTQLNNQPSCCGVFKCCCFRIKQKEVEVR